jgi:hypothetical protein
MGKKITKTIGTRRTDNTEKMDIKEALKICPYEEKKCFECTIQDCPEER